MLNSCYLCCVFHIIFCELHLLLSFSWSWVFSISFYALCCPVLHLAWFLPLNLSLLWKLDMIHFLCLRHDNVFINLSSKPDWYLKRIPSTKVPGLIVEGEGLYESLIIADFLDEKYPERPLHSKNLLQKAKDRILLENFSKVSLVYRLVLDLLIPLNKIMCIKLI